MVKRCILHREIGIDVGHRVPDHGSKCRNPHGHRYRIIATCEGPVIDEAGNEENGMVLDFGNVKKYMMDFLDSVFDHGFVVYKGDKVMMNMFFQDRDPKEVFSKFKEDWDFKVKNYLTAVRNDFKGGTWSTAPLYLKRTKPTEQDPDGLKIIVVDYVPTAENLAAHMFKLLKQPIEAHFPNDDIRLVNIRLYETPNGYVDYPGMKFIDV